MFCKFGKSSVSKILKLHGFFFYFERLYANDEKVMSLNAQFRRLQRFV